MSEVLIKIIIFFIMPVSGFFVGKNILNSNEKIFKLRNILAVLGLVGANFLIYNVEYKAAITLMNFLAIVVCYKIIFKRSFGDSFILAVYMILLTSITEIILSICVLPFFSADLIRNVGIPMLLSNLLIGVVTVLLSKIVVLKKIIFNIFSKLEKHSKSKMLLLCFCWMIITTVTYYFIFKSITNMSGFWIGSAVQICFIIFMIIFFNDKSKYVTLNERFESVYNYLEDMERYINAERLNIHEYKNQLSVIRSMTKDKKILDYIDSIISDTNIDVKWSSELSNLPSGGFKGLIYYKVIQANSKKLNVTIDISPKCRSYFEKLSLEDIKELSRLLGIYLDNAIEASEKSKKRVVSLEIYKNQNINIVVSNSIDGDVDIKNLNKKGYTSKGKGRGHGLYLAKNIIDKNSNIEANAKIVNSYFVQKIILK